jgi:hypothetical protein
MQAASAGHWAVLALIVLVLFVVVIKLFPTNTHLGVRVLVLLVLCVVSTGMWVYAVAVNVGPYKPQNEPQTVEDWLKQRR